MFQDKIEKEGGSPARTLPPSTWTTDDSLRFELREHVRKLRLILPVISVSIMALHRQNAELDYDIASVLSEHACGPLDEEIEHLASLLAACASRSRQGEVCMSTLDEVRTLRATALRLLPGFWQARAQINIAIEVLEYFARDAEHELKTGAYTPPPVDRQIARDIGVLQSMLSAFRRVHEPRE